MDDLVTTYYSYDPHGNVEWLVNELPGLTGTENRQGVLTEYEYDIISGKVIRVAYQPGRYDEFRHHYRYDHDSRLVSVSTSRDSVIWDEDARYEYYNHGPLRRMELGQDSVQGIDYTYTIHGWLKGINTPSLDSSIDVGQDGLVGGDHAAFPRDAFGMILGYHDGDFVRSGSQFASGADWTYAGVSLYNGNISSWTWDSRDITGAPQGALAASYRYDVLNRIKRDTIHARGTSAWEASTGAFETSYSYDPNGNILTLTRNNGSGTSFDNLAYTYLAGTNKLTHIDDTEGSGVHASDLDDQDADNYDYDATGNMTQDVLEDIDLITWTPANKIDSINKGDTLGIKYLYDAMGNRVKKIVWDGSGAATLKATTWYAKDVTGNPMAIYTMERDTGELTLSELPLYGSDRLGLAEVSTAYTTALSTLASRAVGPRQYELKDHLGNVRVVVKDVALDTGGVATASMQAVTDYYPFGMRNAARSFIAGYRFGFNGKENDNEVNGEGNMQDYGFRIHDSRIARFLSVDPLVKEYPMLSSYQFASNTPLWAVDRDGLEAYYVHGTMSNSSRWMNGPTLSEGSKQLFRLTDNKSWNTNFNWGKGPLNWGNGPFNDRIDRKEVAQQLVDHIMQTMNGEESVTLILHSHAGNVGIQAVPMLRERLDVAGYKNTKINLITIGTPADNDPESPENPTNISAFISSHLHLYSSLDAVQSDLATYVTGGIVSYDHTYSNNFTKNIHVDVSKEIVVGSYSTYDGATVNIYDSHDYQYKVHGFDQLYPAAVKRATEGMEQNQQTTR